MHRSALRQPGAELLDVVPHLGDDALGVAGQVQCTQARDEEGQAADVSEMGLQDREVGVRHAGQEHSDDRVDAPDGQQQEDSEAVEHEEVVGADRAAEATEQDTGQAREGGRRGEDDELRPRHAHAEGGARHLTV